MVHAEVKSVCQVTVGIYGSIRKARFWKKSIWDQQIGNYLSGSSSFNNDKKEVASLLPYFPIMLWGMTPDSFILLNIITVNL